MRVQCSSACTRTDVFSLQYFFFGYISNVDKVLEKYRVDAGD